MKTRKLSRLLSIFLVLSLLPILGLGVAGAAPLGQETYTVQKDDTLWGIAEKYLGSGAAYPAIVDATNKKHAEDPTFPDILNPSLIQPGWKLAIPSKEQAEEFMAGYVPPAKASGKITLYTSMPQKIADQVVQEFQTSSPAITVELYRAGTGDVLAKLQTEMEAGAVVADVLWVAEPTIYLDLKDDGKLLSIKPPAAADVDAQYYDPDGFFYGVGVVHMAIAYNTAQVQDPPKTWKDLLDPKWEDKIALARPLDSGAAVHAVGTMVANSDFGWEYFEQLKANGAVAVGGPSDVVKKVAEGEFVIGMTQAPLARQMATKGSPVATSWPTDGAVRKTTVVAVLKDSGNPAAATEFVNFIISEAGQKALADQKVYYPIRAGIESPEGEPPIEDIPALPNDFDFIRQKRDEIVTKFDDIFSG